MSIHKDWRGWWDGLRSKAMKAGAEAIVTNLSGLIATNGVASTVPAFHAVAMTWETAVATTCIQFAIRVVVAAATYVQSKPDPDTIEYETSITVKSSKTTNPPETPAQPKETKP